MEPNSDKTKPWWVIKEINGRKLFYSGCDTQDQATLLAAKTLEEIPKERKAEINVHVTPADESILWKPE